MSRPHLQKHRSSLLDRAIAIPRKTKANERITSDEMEAAIAWMRDEITPTQLARARGDKSPSVVIASLALWLREAYRNSMIEIVKQND